MELQVLYDDQTVKCALIFTGFDQYLYQNEVTVMHIT